MNLIVKQCNKIKAEKRLGLMTHVVVGYPTLDKTISIVKEMAKAGVDFVELQIPFSDPLADGPTIMKACEKSLENGTKVRDALKLMATLSQEVSIPLLFMGYYNNVFKYGTLKFCQDAKKAGACGLIIPDVPLEEENREHLLKYCQSNKLCNIRVISPTSTDERLKQNAAVASGFVYCTLRQGTTGAQNELNPNLATYLKKVRSFFDVPLAVGFGISNQDHIKALKPHADIAVVGSALIEVINNSNKNSLRIEIKDFIQKLKSCC